MQKEMNIPLTIQELGTISPYEYFGAIDKMADAALADACTPANPESSYQGRYRKDLQETVVILKAVSPQAVFLMNAMGLRQILNGSVLSQFINYTVRSLPV